MRIVYFEDLSEGDIFYGDEVLADRDEMIAYNQANDPWPIHVDESAAAASPFGGIIASGGYTITLMYRSLVSIYNAQGSRWEFLGGYDWHVKFLKPVRPGECLTTRLTILSKRLSSKGGRGIVTDTVEVLNQEGEAAMTVDVAFLIATRPDSA